MTSDPIRVLVIDDAVDIQALYSRLIDNEPDMRCVGALGSVRNLMDEIAACKPDILLLDLSIPGESPLEQIPLVAANCAQVRVLVCSGYDDMETANAVLDAGAWGLVSKHDNFDSIVNGIRRVARGELVNAHGTDA